MSRTLGILSTLAAVLALSAVMASAASALGTFTAGKYPTTWTAVSALGNDTFTVDGVPVNCQAHSEGTLHGPSSHLLVTVNYTNCKLGALGASVATSSCQYTFETPAKVKVDHYTAPVQMACVAGGSITIKAPAATGETCHIAVTPQTPVGGVTIVDNTPAGDVTVQANIAGIHVHIIKDSFGCPLAGTGTRTNAAYSQKEPVTYDSTNGEPISVSG